MKLLCLNHYFHISDELLRNLCEWWCGSVDYSHLLFCAGRVAPVLCWHVGKGETLAITSCSPPPRSLPVPRTSILPPRHAGTVLHQLLRLPGCAQRRLSPQKWMWLLLEGAFLATCPLQWEGSTSAGLSDQHLYPQLNPPVAEQHGSLAGTSNRGLGGRQETSRRHGNKISWTSMSSFSFCSFRHFPR